MINNIKEYDNVELTRDLIHNKDFISSDNTDYPKGSKATILELHEDWAMIEIYEPEDKWGVLGVSYNDIKKI